ncbi:MAG: hypothetical protein ACRD2M_10650, partial [Terriglobales bacterium]
MWVSASTVPLLAVTPTAQSWFNATNNRLVASGYDVAGNQTAAGGGTFTFDAENRQKQVTIDMLPGHV